VDPVGLLHDLISEAKSLEHLHRAARDPVGLADQKSAGLLLNDAGCDVRERSELRGQGQTGGAAADDENVNLPRKFVGRSGPSVPDISFEDMRITGPKPIEVELHCASPDCDRSVWHIR